MMKNVGSENNLALVYQYNIYIWAGTELWLKKKIKFMKQEYMFST